MHRSTRVATFLPRTQRSKKCRVGLPPVIRESRSHGCFLSQTECSTHNRRYEKRSTRRGDTSTSATASLTGSSRCQKGRTAFCHSKHHIHHPAVG